jgi:hypothetical protein
MKRHVQITEMLWKNAGYLIRRYYMDDPAAYKAYQVYSKDPFNTNGLDMEQLLEKMLVKELATRHY